MTDHVIYWIPVASRIQSKVLILASRTQHGQASKYLFDLMHETLSAVSSRLLRLVDQQDLLVARKGLPWPKTVHLPL